MKNLTKKLIKLIMLIIDLMYITARASTFADEDDASEIAPNPAAVDYERDAEYVNFVVCVVSVIAAGVVLAIAMQF